ncbi:prepilin-type N-terminal cleavage/methylation domain-containing protein [Acetobacterium sp.]|uniref:prepilin-type N-terminal cleavage/methylation domain-containing protein n=1 Tax=Acetobacterium sp. TaxID=1872094 RepID=UPI00359454DB
MGSKSKLTGEQKIIRLNNVHGFTMMEVIVVIAILGALAALAIPRFTGVLANSQKKTDLANIRIVESAAELYEAEKGEMDSAVDTFDELITQLNVAGYLKNTELTAVSEGKIFTYNSGTKKISLEDDPSD